MCKIFSLAVVSLSIENHEKKSNDDSKFDFAYGGKQGMEII